MDVGALWNPVERTIKAGRRRLAVFDHLMATLDHYGRANGGGQAGAVTYFAFLAFFPIMALAFFVVGQIANVWPDAQETLVRVIDNLLAGLIGTGDGQIPLSDFQDNAARVGAIGAIGFLYAGLGWVSAMRNSLQAMFDKPQKDRPNWIIGKLRDLATLGIVGGMLLVAFAVTTAVNQYDEKILEAVGIDPGAPFASHGLQVLGALLAIFLVTSLLMLLYQFLARPRVSHRALREGALLASVGFVLLKLLADRLIELTHGQPAFTVFGFSLVLLVLINYFSRVIMYGAAWAYTSKREPDLFMDDEPAGPHDRRADPAAWA